MIKITINYIRNAINFFLVLSCLLSETIRKCIIKWNLPDVGDVLFDVVYQVAGGSVAIVVKDSFAVWGQYLTNVSQKPRLF